VFAFRLFLFVALTAAVSVSPACGSRRTPLGVVQGATEADREFLDEIGEILEMARVSATQAMQYAGRPELKEYARQAADEHARQLSSVRSTDKALFGDETAGLGAIPVVISPGPSYDREWLASMIELHQLGVDIASARLEERGEPQAETLARELLASERQQLDRLRAWSREWFGG
jgi:uncharacterized protein (DUF305 family)